jgi:hypothetical protein
MGGAFLARADDATAASWNPAGLSYLRHPELSFVLVDARLGDEKTSVNGALAENDQRRGRAPDFAAFTYPFSLGSTSGAAQLSFQRVLSFDNTRTIEEPDASYLEDPGILGRARLGLADIDRFACHPGGAKVVDASERALSLGHGALDHERTVLADYGNMSAPTALFVLERVIQAGLPSRTLLTALGPGFTASCVSLTRTA